MSYSVNAVSPSNMSPFFRPALFSSRMARPRDQRLAEAGFFQPQRFLDQLFGAHQVRIGLPHLAHQRPDQRDASAARRRRSSCAWRIARRMIRRST